MIEGVKMFGRNREILDYNVYPTKEGAEILAEQALDRIETVEGVDYLDGYKLPADDDGLWEPRKLRISITHTYEHPRTGEIYLAHEEKVIDSSITNQKVRKSNIRSIAKGLAPLYIKWEDVVIPEPETRTPLLQRFRKVANNLIQKVAS